jgi:hypothetical protein
MRLLFLTLILFFLQSTFSYSQCKYFRNETDEFTKKVILETAKVVINPRDITGQSLNFQGYKQDNSRFFKINWSTLDIISVGKGEKLMLKLQNNEVVEVFADNYKVSTPIGNYWTITIYYDIFDSVFQKLKQSEVIKLRFYTADGYVDKEVPKGASKKLLQLLNCIE